MEKINLDNFRDKVMNNSQPVVLEFHGSLCPACVQMEQELNEAESVYGMQIFFGMVDADHEEMINTALHVYDLPALFFFKNGHLITRYNGFVPAEVLQKSILQLLA